VGSAEQRFEVHVDTFHQQQLAKANLPPANTGGFEPQTAVNNGLIFNQAKSQATHAY